jgi:hypothetical protein
MARHALVDVTQIFVRRPPAPAGDRLPPAALRELRVRLADGPVQLPEGDSYEERLAALRMLYEPYAQALAAFLLIELPPWFHPEGLRDNWRGAPWDRQLAARADDELFDEEHF